MQGFDGSYELSSSFFFLFIFYVHWYFASIYVCVKVSDPLELELQTV